MSVKPEHIDNPERDLDLTNRDPKGSDDVRAAIQHAKTGTPTKHDELQALRARLAAAKTAGKDPQPHCRDCFERGWTAAVKEIAGE